MSTAIYTDGSKSRRESRDNKSSTDGVLQIRLGDGESVICHKPGEYFQNLEVRLVSITRDRANLAFIGDEFEVWRSVIWRKRLEDVIKTQR